MPSRNNSGLFFLSDLYGLNFRRCILPFGDFYLIGDDDFLRCALFGSGIKDFQALEKKFINKPTGPIKTALSFLKAYTSGMSAPMPPLDLSAYTKNERTVYENLLKVPFGKTVSYGKLALISGFAGSARFIGNTMAKNRYPLFIPCHRVVKSDGSSGGFSGGVSLKKYLLEYEKK
jgi:methylated-DNA-[protein]-cysteine S-methyltransferase